jgi:ketosteroid isomerase-like protein
MKRLLLALVSSVAISGGVAVGVEDPAAAVEAADASWTQAYLDCNVHALNALLADDLTYIHLGGATSNKEGEIGNARLCNMASLESNITSVRVYGDDAAVVLGSLMGGTEDGFQFELLYTRVYVLQDGAWQLVAHQSTDTPK